jgi:nickel/cobalt exporter
LIEDIMIAEINSAQFFENGWLYFPTAIVLGALHGLEPGHSKTMMAAFIIAVRGTVKQATLLGLAATLSHTVIIWLIVALTLLFKEQIKAENVEPWMQMISGLIVIVLTLWMALRITRDNSEDVNENGHDHSQVHNHGHKHAHVHAHSSGLDDLEEDDGHARAHAEAIRQRFSGGTVTTGQIVLFGLTGGLIPCPGAITVALLSLQANRAALGFALVVAFSIGLAATLVGVGAAAAWSTGQATRRFSFFRQWAPRLPYLSVVLLVVIGGYLLFHGYQGLQSHSH